MFLSHEPSTPDRNLYPLEIIIFPVLIPLVRTCLIALTFSGLPQSNPAAPRPATPAAGQETEHGVEGNLATILQSGSTNTRSYKVVIHNDGSATAEISGAPAIRKSEPATSQQFPPGTINTRIMRRLLAEIGDVGKIPTGGCAKSASFGTRTQITYAGKTRRPAMRPAAGIGRGRGAPASFERVEQIRADNLESTENQQQAHQLNPVSSAPESSSRQLTRLLRQWHLLDQYGRR